MECQDQAEEDRASLEDAAEQDVDGLEGSELLEFDESDDEEESEEENGDAEDPWGDEPANGASAASVGEDIVVASFQELELEKSCIAETQSAWNTFVGSSPSKGACADAIYEALYQASPAIQSMFTSPKAIASMKLFAGINSLVMGLNDPPSLKNAVETLAFGHIALDTNISRVSILRDALLDLLSVELGVRLTPSGFTGLKALLNYVGGAILHVKEFFTSRILLIGQTWALANDGAHGERFATLGSMEAEAKPVIQRDAEDEEVGKETLKEKSKEYGKQEVPTTFPDMFRFNSAVMGFGSNMWMNEVLACFENIVKHIANPSRLTEECDFIVCRIAKVSTGKVNLAEFKATMLASLRSLLPKDWSPKHEHAWSWLWELVERSLAQNMGMPPRWEKAYGNFLDGMDEATGFQLRKDIYATFFALAPEGQDYFKQSNTYLHLVSTKVLNMVINIYRDPVRMVDEISGVGLRHVGYGILTEFFGPFVSATVEVISGLTNDQMCIDGFNWSIGLIAKSTVRTIIEGSTIVMKAINMNTRKSMVNALSIAPRGERSQWMLLIQVGSQNISPLAWAIESGSLESASVMLTDLLTFRADRDRYYYACDETFNRHPNIVKMLLSDAPGLVPELLDGLIWRSRLTFNGNRRVNYYIKHLLINPEGKFAKTLEWIIRARDPRIVCHPALVLLSDIVWSQVASTTFLSRKLTFLFSLVVFIVSQSVLSKGETTSANRWAIFVLRCFIYVVSLSAMIFSHSAKTADAYRRGKVLKVFNLFPVPEYLQNWQEATDFLLTVALMVMLCTEPILTCLQFRDEIFNQSCRDADDIKRFYADTSMIAVFLYYLLLIDLAVLSNRVSAYVLVCRRMLAEVGLFILAMILLILTFSCALTCLDQDLKQFRGIHTGALALWELFLDLCDPEDYTQFREHTFVLIGAFVFLTLSVVFLSNLLIAQLACAYGTIYADMVGYARITRVRVIVETMPRVPAKRWQWFVSSIAFERKIEFNEGDVGVHNGIASVEAASEHPTTVDVIKRFGGSTSRDMKWPAEDGAGSDESDKFERLEGMIKRALEMSSTTSKRGDKKRIMGLGTSITNFSSGASSERSNEMEENSFE